MDNRVIVSTNSRRCYSWYAPLTALAWKHVTEFIPTVLCVGDGIDPVILTRIEEAGGEVVKVPFCPGWNDGGIAQICRLYASACPRYADDYLMTTDIDAWPLVAEPFLPSGRDLDIYMSPWDMLPMGYIGALASTWRTFMGIDLNSVGEALQYALATEPNLRDAFNVDETLVTRRVLAWAYPDGDGTLTRLGADPRFKVVVRAPADPPHDRIQFNHWPQPLPKGMTDAHLCSRLDHPTWAQLRGLLVYGGLSPDALAWADRYHEEVPQW